MYFYILRGRIHTKNGEQIKAKNELADTFEDLKNTVAGAFYGQRYAGQMAFAA